MSLNVLAVICHRVNQAARRGDNETNIRNAGVTMTNRTRGLAQASPNELVLATDP